MNPQFVPVGNLFINLALVQAISLVSAKRKGDVLVIWAEGDSVTYKLADCKQLLNAIGVTSLVGIVEDHE